MNVHVRTGGLFNWSLGKTLIAIAALVAGTFSTLVISTPVSGASCPAPVITSAASVTGVAGTPFAFTVTSCSSTAAIKASRLPSGLRLTSNGDGTASITGTPVVKDFGPYAVTLTATVIGETAATQALTVIVDNASTVTLKSADTARTGTTVSFPITTHYGYPVPTITTTSSLPAGMSLIDHGDGTAALSGDPGPTSGGIYPITITMNTGVTSKSAGLTLTVRQIPVLTSSNAVSAIEGVAMAPFQVTASGYPTPILRATGLPHGVTMVGGELQGTPAKTGTYAVAVSAKNAAGTVKQTLSFSVTSNAATLSLDQPTAIANDGGSLWITNVGNNTVTKISTTGALEATLSGTAYALNDPVAVVGNGSDLFVLNTGGSVTEIDEQSDAVVRVIQGSNYAFNSPTALLLSGGNVWVVNKGGNSVTVFSASTGSLVQLLTNASNSSYAFDQPVALGVVGSNIWIVNSTGASVSDLNAGSATVVNATTGAFVQKVSGSSDGLESPAGVTYNNGDVWITDSASYQITELTTSGALVQVITNSSNDANYGFDHPTAIVPYGNYVYVVDPPGSSPMITEVNATNSEGDWYECNTNVPDPDFDNPTGIAINGTNAWVVSPPNNTLTELNLSASGTAINWFH